MNEQVLWHIRRATSSARVEGTATLPNGNSIKQHWPNVTAFITNIDKWVNELTQKFPDVRVIPQDWPASRPTWPWPEDLSAEDEWNAFLAAWQTHFKNRPVRNSDLIRFAKSANLLPRFFNDPGYVGPLELRLSIVLRCLASWHGYYVSVVEKGLYSISNSPLPEYIEIATKFRGMSSWERADATVRTVEILKHNALSRLSMDTGFATNYLSEMLRTAKVFPPESRNPNLTFTRHRRAAGTSDPYAAIAMASKRRVYRRESVQPLREITVGTYLPPKVVAEMDAQRGTNSRSGFIRDLLVEHFATEPPYTKRLNPSTLEQLTQNTTLSEFWNELTPWVDHLGPQGLTWFRKWPLAPGVIERIEAVWPLLAQR